MLVWHAARSGTRPEPGRGGGMGSRHVCNNVCRYAYWHVYAADMCADLCSDLLIHESLLVVLRGETEESENRSWTTVNISHKTFDRSYSCPGSGAVVMVRVTTIYFLVLFAN